MTEGPTRGEATLRVWTRSILIAIVVWVFLRTFVVEAVRIPSGSMESTLLVGDFLFVRKAFYTPHRGDLVVFESVEEPGRKLVKRVIGLPGDTLSMEAGNVIRNGRGVAEPYAVNGDPEHSESPDNRARMRRWELAEYVGADADDYLPNLHDWGPIVVPPDSLFVLGDNRDASYDSRYWGFVPRRNVRGHPALIYFSREPDSWNALPLLSRVRWGRIFSLPE
jgi:signal peptidase I